MYGMYVYCLGAKVVRTGPLPKPSHQSTCCLSPTVGLRDPCHKLCMHKGYWNVNILILYVDMRRQRETHFPVWVNRRLVIHTGASLESGRRERILTWLALLNYASRVREIEIRPSSVRSSVSQLYLFLMHGCLSNFDCCFPWAIRPDIFWILKKKNLFFFLDLLRRFLVFVNMGPYTTHNFKMLLLLQITAERF